MIGLGGVRLGGHEAEEHGARLVELALLDVLLGEGQVRIARLGRELDGFLELGLGVGEAALPPEDIREREVWDRAQRLEGGGLLGRLDGAYRIVGARQPLGELAPELGGVRIALEGAPQRRDRLLEAARSRVHLRDRVVVVGGGPRIAEAKRLRGLGALIAAVVRR